MCSLNLAEMPKDGVVWRGWLRFGGRQRIELNGSEGSLWWDMEDPNRLHVFLLEDEREGLGGFRDVLVTNPDHPFLERWWPPGHRASISAPSWPGSGCWPWGCCSRRPWTAGLPAPGSSWRRWWWRGRKQRRGEFRSRRQVRLWSGCIATTTRDAYQRCDQKADENS